MSNNLKVIKPTLVMKMGGTKGKKETTNTNCTLQNQWINILLKWFQLLMRHPAWLQCTSSLQLCYQLLLYVYIHDFHYSWVSGVHSTGDRSVNGKMRLLSPCLHCKLDSMSFPISTSAPKGPTPPKVCALIISFTFMETVVLDSLWSVVPEPLLSLQSRGFHIYPSLQGTRTTLIKSRSFWLGCMLASDFRWYWNKQPGYI